MSVNNKTYQPLLKLTLKANQDVPAFRFVDFNGNRCGNNVKALGCSDIGYNSGDSMSIIAVGTATIETSGAITKGNDVASATDGKGRSASPGEKVVGRALDTCTGADFIRILLVP
jgi:hypothetical protein